LGEKRGGGVGCGPKGERKGACVFRGEIGGYRGAGGGFGGAVRKKGLFWGARVGGRGALVRHRQRGREGMGGGGGTFRGENPWPTGRGGRGVSRAFGFPSAGIGGFFGAGTAMGRAPLLPREEVKARGGKGGGGGGSGGPFV